MNKKKVWIALWLLSNPWTGQSADDTRIPGEFSDLYSSGTPMNRIYNRMLDELAEPLTELQRAGVVVLIRPFHEQNGKWFWCGIRGLGPSRVPISFPRFGDIRSFT